MLAIGPPLCSDALAQAGDAPGAGSAAPAAGAGATAGETDVATGDVSSSTDAGPSAELRDEGDRIPSIWETLRAQYAPPLGPLPTTPDVASVFRATPARLTLREAVLAAIQNNPGLISQSLTPSVENAGILAAQAQFDPIVGADLNLDRLKVPAGSVLQGATLLATTNRNWNFFAQKQLLSGGLLRLEWNNNRLVSDSQFQGLVPQYAPDVLLSLNQPLLRGFGLYFSRLNIRIAETATDAAIAQYRANVANFITQVIQAYWDVVRLTEQLGVLQSSLDLARQTVRDNQIRVDVGVLPPVAIKESEAEAARREEEVIVATNALGQARRRLRQVVYVPTGEPYTFPRPVEPVDRPVVDRVAADYEQSLAIAMEKRNEIIAARLALQSNELNVALNKNQLLPRVDLYGAYGINSLSGTAVPVESPANPGVFLVSPFGGTYGDALGRMFEGDTYYYQGGVRIEVPIGNAAAKAAYTQSRVQEQQALYSYRQTVSDVALDVGQTVGDVISNLQRIAQTRVARELSEENLRNQTKRYDVGMVTTTDLLIFQDQVARARLAEIQAVIDYNNSLAALERAQGTLLERYNVTVADRGDTITPWWARF
ncbi:MAG: TolC family protein [Thermodesulfobacteriota bacterium]